MKKTITIFLITLICLFCVGMISKENKKIPNRIECGWCKNRFTNEVEIWEKFTDLSYNQQTKSKIFTNDSYFYMIYPLEIEIEE